MVKKNLIGVEQLLRDSSQSYAELGYMSEPFPYTTPAFLEAHARLMGLTVASSKGAKVLELGGSFGGNLLTQAFLHQDSQFTVVDFSKDQIEQGKKIVEELGLENIQLVHKNIMDIDPSFGTFDYIIAHGVYSWVDDKVKERLLSIFQHNLADTGVGYISYNTYPGWHTMDEVRNLMLFANRPKPEASHGDKVRRGKYVASILGATMYKYDDLKQRNGKLLSAFQKVVSQPDYYVGHDHLEEHNDPVYVQEMVDQWSKYKLAYVCDADLTLSFVDIVDAEVAETVNKLAEDRIGREQYVDFLLDTSFRKSIIVKATKDHQAVLDAFQGGQAIPKERLDQFSFRLAFGKDVVDSFSAGLIKDFFSKMLNRGGSFTMTDALDVLGPVEEADIEALYKAVLEHVVRGGIHFSVEASSFVAYEPGKVYVPSEYTNFAATMILGAGQGHVVMGSYLNESASYINSIDVEIMSILNEPKSDRDILKALEGIPIYDTSHGEPRQVTPEEYLPIGLSHIEQLGFLKRK